MYDAVRIVDPVCKQVLDYRGCAIGTTNEICYDYWKSGLICDNCISIRAHLENRSYMKLEQTPDLIMMVTALPVDITDKSVVLELLKNATDSMMIGSGDYNDGNMMHNVVSQINDMIMKDSLTSLYNRRFINERLPVDLIKATIKGEPISVILMDVDNLKEINDTYGHLLGDQALREIGNVLSSSLRAEYDWSARYGGDEFLICLNNTNSDDAYQIAERIRISIEKIQLPTQPKKANITVSLGIHTSQGVALTAEELIDYADGKLSEAKKDGKNRIVYNQDIQKNSRME